MPNPVDPQHVKNPISLPVVFGQIGAGAAIKGAGLFGAAGDAAFVQQEQAAGPSSLAGVYGVSDLSKSAGLFGENDVIGGYGVRGLSNAGYGVRGSNGDPNKTPAVGAGVWAESVNGYGIYAHSATGTSAYIDGSLHVVGNAIFEADLLLQNADIAEEFPLASDDVEPGAVMVIGEGGNLSQCSKGYDRRAAGIASGAGNFKPAITLDSHGQNTNRIRLALTGKAYCKVDATHGAIEVGDLLTTSATPGHAMKASDRDKAFGAVIGKALDSLSAGQGLIPVLVSLQ